MKLLEQNKEYNCGVYAVHFFLKINGIDTNLEQLEIDLCTTEKNGTTHHSIIDYFKNYPITFGYNTGIENIIKVSPAIVNYQYDGDGHYGVVLNVTDKNVILYNPATGEIDLIDILEFEKIWYSDRYGKQWFLSMI